jgi:DNA-binding MarR family transcriptional regulator/N-acetylglutamate synthase-like GNAT family acetyltransferase
MADGVVRARARTASRVDAAKHARNEARIRAVRRFNRFYTQHIGVLQEGLLHSPFALTEVRVLYELAHWSDGAPSRKATATATALAQKLGIDEGYLSRILRNFARRGLVKRTPSQADGRWYLLSLTARGRKAFAPLEARSRAEVGALLGRLSALEQGRLQDAMVTIERLLGASRAAAPGYALRAPRPGDIGWVVHRHGALYAAEYGYDERFEALVAQIAARFVQKFDAKAERCWIAERDGQILGCVFVVRQSRTVAKLRLLMVEPSARGIGLGGRLVDECVSFAQAAGYRKIVLWTQSELVAARALYLRAGFRLINSEPHKSFGRSLVAETWELKLNGVTARRAIGGKP